MGIIEAIREEIFEQGQKKGQRKAIIEGIQNALKEGLSLQQISRIFKVEIEFVQEVQKGNIKIEE